MQRESGTEIVVSVTCGNAMRFVLVVQHSPNAHALEQYFSALPCSAILGSKRL